MKYDVFSVALGLTNSYSPISGNYAHLKYLIPPTLKNVDSPLNVLDGYIDSLIHFQLNKIENERSENVVENLKKYQELLRPTFSLLQFYIDICQEDPTLERPCCEDMKSFKLQYGTVINVKEQVDKYLAGKIGPKKIKRTIENIQNSHSSLINALKQIRSILFTKYIEEKNDQVLDTVLTERSLYTV